MEKFKHEIKITNGKSEDLKEMLLADGLLSPQTVYGYNQKGKVEGRSYSYVLDLSLCDKEGAYKDVDPKYMFLSDTSCENWVNGSEENIKKRLAEGWEMDPNKPDGNFRRKWDKQVYESIPLVPLNFIDKTTIEWYSEGSINDRPVIVLSKRYPMFTFAYEISSKFSYIGVSYIRNGERIN